MTPTPDRFQEIRAIFERALEHNHEDRGAFLDDACGNDQELRLAVNKLLVVEEMGGELKFPNLPMLGSCNVGQYIAALVGAQIGSYKTAQIIGQGGMGSVYLAKRMDKAFERCVAIKVMHPGVNTAAMLGRFQQERQILADLDHPNIGHLLDAGSTPDGLPYLVMEYIDGLPINEYCDKHGLNVTHRIELFRTVCAAVQYAHQRLIVHRDIKPSNVLVTADGKVKLLDFGIAKLLSCSDERANMCNTRQGHGYLMTPEYASPEQIRGEAVTTATDVFSLGVLLYELLTGRRPYRLKGRTVGEMARMICEEEPPRPSTVVGENQREGRGNCDRSDPTSEQVSAVREGRPERLKRRLNGDLDHIVFMALRKEPGCRYSSVEHLSDDLGRHLGRLPVRARRDTLRYRGSKFVRRHRAAIVTAMLIVITVTYGAAATIWQAQLVRAERTRADQEQRGAAEQRILAERERMTAERAATEAEQQRLSAENQTRIAERERAQAEEQSREAQKQRTLAQQAATEAEQQRLSAENQTRIAERERARAEEQTKEAQNQRTLVRTLARCPYTPSACIDDPRPRDGASRMRIENMTRNGGHGTVTRPR